VLGTSAKRSFGQWIKRLWTNTSIDCRTAPETSPAELLGFLVLQEWQNERLAREPEGDYNVRHSGRFLGV